MLCPSTMPSMSTTCPDRQRPSQAGFTLVSMVFILVVLALLGAAMARFSMRQQLGSASELAAAKALQAANAGLEWASFQVLRTAPACFASTTLNLGEFLSTVTCTQTSGSDGGVTLLFYTVTATACNAPSAGLCPATGALQASYVERQMTRRLVR